MKEIKTLLLVLVIIAGYLFLSGCNKCQAAYDNISPSSPWDSPVWYPDGSFLAFNHMAVKSSVLTNPDCHPYYSVVFHADSVGFWFVDKNGSNLRKVTDFEISEPAWSPDGKWLAFDLGGICKMAFNGTTLDTAHIIHLTDNLFSYTTPSWSPTGDSIYYVSNRDAPIGTNEVSIFKMAADGKGQRRITDTATTISYSPIEPYCTIDNQILHLRTPINTQNLQVFTMDSDGHNIRQITSSTGVNDIKNEPRYFNNRIYYEDMGAIWTINDDGTDNKSIGGASGNGFSISTNGSIAYVNFAGIVDKTQGTIWIMDINGANAKPLTFNYY